MCLPPPWLLLTPFTPAQRGQETQGKSEDFSCGKYTGDEAQSEEIKVGAFCFANGE